MVVRLSILLLLSSLTLTYNYGQENDSIKTKCSYRILKVDQYNHQNIVPGDYIIKTYSDLVDYWESAFGPLSITPLPNVYFCCKMIIVLDGDYGKVGDCSKIKCIYETKDKMIVDIEIIAPKGRYRMMTEWKCTIIEIPKTDKTIEIKRTKA